jgi:hypothetical protein
VPYVGTEDDRAGDSAAGKAVKIIADHRQARCRTSPRHASRSDGPSTMRSGARSHSYRPAIRCSPGNLPVMPHCPALAVAVRSG